MSRRSRRTRRAQDEEDLHIRSNIKPPTYSGETDIELFILQFEEVAEVNEWTDIETRLHLRSSLTGSATDCGRGQSAAEILHLLRNRFGMTVQQAKDKLLHLQKPGKQNLHQHAIETRKLVDVAFPQLGGVALESMAMDYFINSIGNTSLKRHMLVIRPNTLMEATQAAVDYLSVGQDTNVKITQIEKKEAGSASTLSATFENSMETLSRMMQSQTEMLSKLMTHLATDRSKGETRQLSRLKCFVCGGPHFKKDCPTWKLAQTKETPKTDSQGNDAGLVQNSHPKGPGHPQV